MQLLDDSPSVLFENQHVVFIYKPSNFLSVRSRFHTVNPRENVFDYFEQSPRSAPYLPLHRLDFEAAGLMIAAKTSAAQKQISQYFEKRQISKTYWALSIESSHSMMGKLPFEVQKLALAPAQMFKWESKILRGKKRSYSSPAGDVAVTEARYIGASRVANFEINRWELFPRTGRSHQLRFELSRHEQPIVGDTLYFAPLVPAFARGIALLAKGLDFSECPGYEALGLARTFALEVTWDEFLAQVQASNSLPVA